MKSLGASGFSGRISTISKKHVSLLVVFIFLVLQVGWATAVVVDNKGTDFYLYYLAAKGLQQGQDIYNLDTRGWQKLAADAGVPHYAPPYRYPPLTALVVEPFTVLSPRYAFAVWSAMNVLVLVLAVLLLSRLASDRWVSPLIFIGAAIYVPVLATIYAGQINLLVLLAVSAYALWFAREHKIGAGLALAMGTMLKPIPITLGLHALWRLQSQVVASVLIGLLLFALLTLPVVGTVSYESYLHNSLHLAGLGKAALPTTYPPNQGLSGFFGRVLTSNSYGSSLTDNPALAHTLTLITSLALVVVTAMLCWPRRSLEKTLFLSEVGLVVVATHLVAPISWYHHMALAFIALVAAWVALPRERLLNPMRTVLLASYVLIELQGLLWHRMIGHTVFLSLGTYALLLLWMVLAWEVIHYKWLSPGAIE